MTVDYSELRIKMVDGQLRTTDVNSHALLSAMLSIPRENFVPDARKTLAYIDDDILLSDKSEAGARYLMEPGPFAKLVQLAEVGPEDKVLIVGAGSGYSAAVLSRMAKAVVALENDGELADRAEAALATLGCENVRVVRGPLPDGCKDSAPYDVILLEGSVDERPDFLLKQLADKGRLAVVEGRGNSAAARIYTKAEGVATGRRAFNAAVKPLPGFERVPAFEF